MSNYYYSAHQPPPKQSFNGGGFPHFLVNKCSHYKQWSHEYNAPNDHTINNEHNVDKG